VLPSHWRVRVPHLPQAWLSGSVQLWPVQAVPHWQSPPQVWVPWLPHARVSPGVQLPSLWQVPQLDHWPLLPSQVRVLVPHLPHAWVDDPGQVIGAHVLHWQLPPQLRTPPLHDSVAPGAQVPSPVQADQAEGSPVLPSQVRVRVPHLPHASTSGIRHFCWVQAAPHWQSPPQVWTPSLPQVRVSPGAQLPSFPQVSHPDHWPLLPLQVRFWVPHLPHACAGEPPHIW
jgi:hypothetical protein